MTEKTMYLAMSLHRWGNVRIKGLPDGLFGGMNNGSIGFMPVFDDADKLKAAYPDVEITPMESTSD